MRLFIAIDFNEADYFKQYQDQLKQLSDKLQLGYTLPATFHLTLKFLGDIEETKLDEIAKRLNNLKFDACTAKIKSLGVFPTEDYIRVVWIGFDNETCICNLQKGISSNLRDILPEETNFKAHLTLERVKFMPANNKNEFIAAVKKIQVKPQEFKINEFKLIESTLTKTGPVYKTLKTFKCAV